MRNCHLLWFCAIVLGCLTICESKKKVKTKLLVKKKWVDPPKRDTEADKKQYEWAFEGGSKGDFGAPNKVPYLGIDGKQLLAVSGPGVMQRRGEDDMTVVNFTAPPKSTWFKPKKRKWCTKVYKQMSENWEAKGKERTHIMCDINFDPKPRVKFRERGVDLGDVMNILKFINARRRNPSLQLPKDKLSPPQQMFKVYWDPNAAKNAQRVADSCPDKEDRDAFIRIPGYRNQAFGSTMCLGSHETWGSCLVGWYNTSQNFKWHQGELDEKGPSTIPYAEMMNDAVFRMGCGYTWCNKGGGKEGMKVRVCHFVQSDDRPNDKLLNPFRHHANKTEAAGKCPAQNRKGLCDCEGKACYNGEMIINECSCNCFTRHYMGPSCETYKCSKIDHRDCGKSRDKKQGRPYSRLDNDCHKAKVKRDCPSMCKWCKKLVLAPKAHLINEKGEVTKYAKGSLL